MLGGVEVLSLAARLAAEHLATIDRRPVGPTGPVGLDAELPEEGVAAERVVSELAAGAAPGLVASPGPRYFGFVTGGALPVAVAADWLTSAWDQNAALGVMSPAAAAAEDVVGAWVRELLGLPAGTSVGLVTGAQAANVTALAAARHAVLARAGWDVGRDGLTGAPPVRVVVGEQAHATIGVALRLLGLGEGRAERVPADDQGRMDPSGLNVGEDPTIVCAQAGEVNTGAFDPLEPLAELCGRHGAWLHVDGAFGLWAAASPGRRDLTTGAERADSWATDAHKWLNVPYDCGIVAVADADAHRAAMAVRGPYLIAGDLRDGADFVPEASRRARAFTVYAALRHLGRQGVAALVERCCALAARAAEHLHAGGVTVLNDVVLNQVLLDLGPEVAARVQHDGTCWVGGTVWRGRPALRLSVSNWSTTAQDVDRAAGAILSARSARTPAAP